MDRDNTLINNNGTLEVTLVNLDLCNADSAVAVVEVIMDSTLLLFCGKANAFLSRATAQQLTPGTAYGCH